MVFEWITNLAIGLLFFMHGAKLSGSAILAGMGHWRLHLLVFSCTFVLFPLLGSALRPLLTPMIGAELYGHALLMRAAGHGAVGHRLTSLARGNIPAAVCSAAASSLIGIFLTPLLVLLLMGAQGEGGSTLDAIGKIVVQLLLPFIAGQIARRWIGDWVARNKGWLKNVDQSSILLVVYTAFSHAVVEGIWQQVPLPQLLGLCWPVVLLLALALLSTVDRPLAGLRHGRPHHHPLRRLEEESRHRHPHGAGAVRRRRAGHADPAVDAVPPDPADGLRGTGAALCIATGDSNGRKSRLNPKQISDRFVTGEQR